MPDVLDLSTLRLRNSKRATVAIAGAIAAAGLDWTMGAPTLTMQVADAQHVLLRGAGSGALLDTDNDGRLDAGISLQAGGESYYLTGVGKDAGNGEPLKLVHWIPYFWDQADSYLTAPAGAMTRPQFIASMVRQSPVPFEAIIPELTKATPHTSSQRRAHAREQTKRDAQRARGFAKGVRLKIQGQEATDDQLRLLSVELSRADARKSPERAVLAGLATIIVESLARNLSGGDGTSSGPMQVTKSTAAGLHIDPRSETQVFDAFHLRGFAVPHGADELARKNPSWSPARIAQTVQGSRYPERYQTKDGIDIAAEARAFLKAWGGSASGDDAGTKEVAGFARGSKDEREGSFVAAGRLGDQVQRRRCVAQGRLYWAPDSFFMSSRPAVTLSETHPSVEKISWEADSRALVRRMQVEVRADAATLLQLAARTVVVEDEGPIAVGAGDGRWLVTALSMQAIGEQRGTIELSQPRSALPEPKSTTAGAGGSTMSSKVAASKAKGEKFNDPRVIRGRRRIDQITAQHQLYLWGGGHSGWSGPYDCSGLQSAVLHAMGLLSSPQTTTGLSTWGVEGEGEVFTLWVKLTGDDSTSHTYSTWKTRSGGLRICESGDHVSRVGGWRPGGPHPRAGFKPRHWDGL